MPKFQALELSETVRSESTRVKSIELRSIRTGRGSHFAHSVRSPVDQLSAL